MIEFTQQAKDIALKALASDPLGRIAGKPKVETHEVLMSLEPLRESGDIVGGFLVMEAWVRAGVDIATLIRYAKDHRADPKIPEVGAVLHWLRDRLMVRDERARGDVDVVGCTVAAREWFEAQAAL